LPLVSLTTRKAFAEAQNPFGNRVLVLLELNGGPDGLNLVVPLADPAYKRARPNLALPRNKLLQLSERLALASELERLMTPWNDGDLAIALGVGYPRPNRSHFRSIEIWNAASDSDDTLQAGWIARALAEAGASIEGPLGGAALGGTLGPLGGSTLKAVSLRDPKRLQISSGSGESDSQDSLNPALRHILAVRTQTHRATEVIRDRLRDTDDAAGDFPRSPLGQQLAFAARLITAGIPLGVLKVTQSGYDTHAGQAQQLSRLARDLAQSLAAFRRALIANGAWDRTLLLSYSEFGRRVKENASGGTDHGTAAPHFLMGGRVKGGFYGSQPSLTDLEGGDLKHRMDFRRLYATVLQSWWNLPSTPGVTAGLKPLPCIT